MGLMACPKTAIWSEAGEHEASLLDAIERLHALFPRSSLGRGAHWTSPKILHREPECEPLIDWARREVDMLGSVHAWAHVMGNGDWIHEHDHQKAVATAIYYVVVDYPGPLLLKDREPIEAKPGLLAILDGRQVHSIAPYGGARRIAIAMNFYG